ncbi:MAG: hypothetical protein IPL46_23695 [Saprospiraceae bacterium]|nr:hypothetical protein [Saprospiraceae bacterium]
MKKHRFLNILFFTLFMFCMRIVEAQNDILLKNSFKEPPISAFPKTYWWWLNGNIDTVRIREEMLAMKEAGLSGFDIFDIGVRNDTVVKPGPAFLGGESLQAIRVALDLAKDLGMTAGLSMASSWNAGGSWITPKHSAKSIYFSVTHKPDAESVKLQFPRINQEDDKGGAKNIQFEANGRPVYYEEVTVLAIPKRSRNQILDTSEVIIVTPYFDADSEMLNWSVSGDYEIYRYVCSNSGEQLKLPSENSKGPIIDHFDAEATSAHFRYVIDKLKTILPNGIKNSALKSLYLASYEATGFTRHPRCR